MGRDDQKPPSTFPSSVPETGKIDSSWDEDLNLAFPGFEDRDDSGDRITAVPDVPMSDLARDLMASAESETNDDASPPHRRPTLKESLRAPGVPGGARAVPLGEDLSLEYDPDSGRPTARHPEPEFGEFGTLEFGEAPTEPPLSEDPLPSTTPGAFDFDDIPPREEMPTLDISEGVDEALGSGTREHASKDDEAQDMVLDLSDLSESLPPTKPSPLPRVPISEKSGLELDDQPPPITNESSPHQELHDRYAVGDFTGALVIADSILEQSPDDIEAKRYSQSCRDVLMQMYSARMGSLEQVVTVAIPPDQIRWLSLDHRAGFLLSLVDGFSSVDDILDICGVPRLDALRIMYQLLEQRVITVGQP